MDQAALVVQVAVIQVQAYARLAVEAPIAVLVKAGNGCGELLLAGDAPASAVVYLPCGESESAVAVERALRIVQLAADRELQMVLGVEAALGAVVEAEIGRASCRERV